MRIQSQLEPLYSYPGLDIAAFRSLEEALPLHLDAAAVRLPGVLFGRGGIGLLPLRAGFVSGIGKPGQRRGHLPERTEKPPDQNKGQDQPYFPSSHDVAPS